MVHYFKIMVNNIYNDKKVAAFLTLLGKKTYSLLRNFTSPEKPAENNFDELCLLFKAVMPETFSNCGKISFSQTLSGHRRCC